MLSKYDLFISLSYVPDFCSGFGWLGYEYRPVDEEDVSGEGWWIKEGIRAYRRTIIDELAQAPANAMHVIPLSGGLDSRAILAGLMENLPASQMVTVTYGIPGSWDYEIAKMITRKFHITHEPINLLTETWDLDEIMTAAACVSQPVNVFEWYVRWKINRHYGTNCVYWSGFLGDMVSGRYMLKEPITDKTEAINDFLRSSRTPNFKKEYLDELIADKISNEFPWQDLSTTNLSYDQQLELGLPERCYIYPLVKINGYDVRTPFTNKTWVNFMLNVPHHLLVDQYLYKRILWENYHSLFDLPIKRKYGSPMFASDLRVFFNRIVARIKPKVIRKDPYGSHPRTNYINFTEEMRHKGCFQDLIYTTLQDLSKRGVYNPELLKTWWNEHISRKANNTRMLLNLSSLEILVKAGSI